MNHQSPATTNLLHCAARVLARQNTGILFAYLFGSLASKEEDSASDVDIAVFCAAIEPETCFELKLELHADLCRALGRNDVDIVVLNTATNLVLLDEIIRKGIVFYETDPAARADFEVRTILKGIDFKSHRLAVIGM
ncbi:MAG: type VII toxin-antitoxin system MntA family adenylyltransferase antitoxin [Thermodesulfobacteriota bacterium]